MGSVRSDVGNADIDDEKGSRVLIMIKRILGAGPNPKRRYAALAAAVCCTMALAACGGSGDSADETTAPLTRITVAMNWITPSAGTSPYMTAREQGYYEEAGLDVNFTFLQGSNLAAQAVGTGNADLADVDANSILIGLSQDIPMTVIAAPFQNSPMGIVTLTENNINSLEDLAGKTVSTAAAGPDNAVLGALLDQLGIKDKVKLSYVDPTAKCTLMVAGNSDACTGQNTGHIGQVEANGKDANFIPFSTDAQPIPGTSVVANNDFLKKYPDVARKFLEATYRGAQEADRDIEVTIDLMQRLRKEAGGSEADIAGIESGVRNAHTLWRSPFTEEHGWGWIDPAGWDTLQNMLFDAGVIEKNVDVSGIFSNDYLPENAFDF